MRDPIEELENFTIPGPPMTPLPAAEVRRRGTRIRRRNTALATAGGLAVVAAIVAPVAFLLGGHQDDSVQPAPPAFRQSVPDGFPLDKDMYGNPPVVAMSGIDDITLCGTTVWSPDSPVATVDVAGARYEENEAYQGRTLAVYADENAAARALDAIRQGVADCPRDENGGGLPLVNDPLSLDLSGEDWFAAVQQAKDGQLLSDLTVWEVARFGNALLLDSSYGSTGGEDAIAAAAALLANRSEAVRAQLCVFSAEPCQPPRGPATPGIGEGAVSSIPQDLPLGRGLSSPEGDPVDGPSATAQGVPALDLCGASVWPVTGVERLAVTVTGPEYRESRELVTFASSADLTAALDALRAAVASCAPEGGLLTPYDAAVGDNSVTFALTPQTGLGGAVHQFVQVGRALLASYRAGEWSPETLPQGFQEATAASADLVPDLCPFTERGC